MCAPHELETIAWLASFRHSTNTLKADSSIKALSRLLHLGKSPTPGKEKNVSEKLLDRTGLDLREGFGEISKVQRHNDFVGNGREMSGMRLHFFMFGRPLEIHCCHGLLDSGFSVDDRGLKFAELGICVQGRVAADCINFGGLPH